MINPIVPTATATTDKVEMMFTAFLFFRELKYLRAMYNATFKAALTYML